MNDRPSNEELKPRTPSAEPLFDLDEAERILAREGDQGRPLSEFWPAILAQADPAREANAGDRS